MNITTLLAVAALCIGTALHAATVTVFAAASLTDSLRDIGRQYESATGDKVEFNFAASSLLERQIEEGAPADIFFSADEAKMDALQKKGLIQVKTRQNRLSNLLVIVVPAESAIKIGSPKDLTDAAVKHIAIGNPEAVPAGIYAKQYLQRMNLWDDIAPKVVPMENVRAALAVVESGDAEAGIVYKTDAALSKKARIACTISKAVGPKIRYPVALLKETREPKAARAFLNFLGSDTAGKIFEHYGFILTGSAQ
jgi:molybdate transport system substrate-binding protein